MGREGDDDAEDEEARLQTQARTWAWVCLLLTGSAVAFVAYILFVDYFF